MTTANEVLAGALRLITSLTPGEATDGTEAANALVAMNAMLASWGAQELMVPARTVEGFALTPGKASYTVGPGGDFDTVRPDVLTGAYRRDASGRDTPVTRMTAAQYDAVSDKTLSAPPDRYYYDPQPTLGVLYLETAPDAAYTLFLDSKKPVAQFSSLTASLTLPPEYAHALKYLVADELADEYGFSIQPGSRLAKKIDDARRFLKRKNAPAKAACFDPAFSAPRRTDRRAVIEG